MAWEFYEEQFLIENYERLSVRAIAKQLNRSVQSVRGKIARLDCLPKANHNWWLLSKEKQLWEWYEQGVSMDVLYWRLNRKYSKAAINAKLTSLKKKNYGQNRLN